MVKHKVGNPTHNINVRPAYKNNPKLYLLTPWQPEASGGYSNLGARGKNFQKFMLSEKKKRSDLGLDIFLPKSKCSLKKKKVFTSISSLISLFFFQNQGVLQKKVFTPNRPLSESETVYAVFEGGSEATASFASPNIHHCRRQAGTG